MLRPRDSHDQRVIEASLEISPEPRSLHFVQDAFGNHVGIARFSGRAKELCFESTVCLEHSPLDAADLDLEDPASPFPVVYSADEMPDLAYSIERDQPDPGNEVGRWAHQFLPPSGSIGTLELLTRLSQGINHGFLYRRREAKGIQQPVETLRLGHGSCRDFAMLMIEAARSLGFAARFASGYLAVPLDDPKELTSGSARGSTHAWAQIYLPGPGWTDRPHDRQRRQDRPCHRCGRARSAPRDPAPRHLHRVLVGPSRHGGASECHVRYARGDLGHSSPLHVATIPPIGLIDVGDKVP
jgi:transglutaminase-like putative cysteine protease